MSSKDTVGTVVWGTLLLLGIGYLVTVFLSAIASWTGWTILVIILALLASLALLTWHVRSNYDDSSPQFSYEREAEAQSNAAMRTRTKRRRPIPWWRYGLLVFFLYAYFTKDERPPQPLMQDEAILAKIEGKEHLEATLKDPYSYEIIADKVTANGGGTYTYWARYRAKNSFGAFVVSEYTTVVSP